MNRSMPVLVAIAVLAVVGFMVVPPVFADESTDATAPASFFALRQVEPSAAQALGEAELRAIKGAALDTTFYLPASNPNFPGAGSPQGAGAVTVYTTATGVSITTNGTNKVGIYPGKMPKEVFINVYSLQVAP